MTYYDIFNGDADGICALQQLRLVEPVGGVCITSVKRDIALLERVEAAAGDDVTALDISLDTNRAGLDKLLARGARVRYFDHHFAGEIPNHLSLVITYPRKYSPTIKRRLRLPRAIRSGDVIRPHATAPQL